MSLPTLTIDEVAAGIQDSPANSESKKVLESLLNDYMDLQYGKETPYTLGQQVIPTGTTIEDVESAFEQESKKKYKDVFEKIFVTAESGDLTPQSKSDGSWDPKLTPVLVLITPNPIK